MMPSAENLAALIERLPGGGPTLGSNPTLLGKYRETLFGPLQEFLARPRKEIRANLVCLGQMLGQDAFGQRGLPITDMQVEQASLFRDVIEFLHAASLIVDDIEDQSHFRRGRPALHKLHGLPLALNAGNWLYFWPLVMLQRAPLPGPLKVAALSECHETLLLAHTGQALDLGTPMSQLAPGEAVALSLKAIEFKSGVLTALALKLGALTVCPLSTGGGHPQVETDSHLMAAIDLLGRRLGQLLQFYDDIGNLTSVTNPQKQFEDLRSNRPSFLWIALAETTSFEEYQRFIREISDLSHDCDGAWMYLAEKWNLADRAKRRALAYKDMWLRELNSPDSFLSKETSSSIEEFIERLTNAY